MTAEQRDRYIPMYIGTKRRRRLVDAERIIERVRVYDNRITRGQACIAAKTTSVYYFSSLFLFFFFFFFFFFPLSFSAMSRRDVNRCIGNRSAIIR